MLSFAHLPVRTAFRRGLRCSYRVRWASAHAGDGVKQAIKYDEFVPMLEECKPPSGWPRKLAIAFSGGPDSTALLHLLKEALSKGSLPDGMPKELLAITVDHGLQAASKQMTTQCSKLAQKLNIPHISVSIPWSHPPFPPLPESKSDFETVARNARYHLLLRVMAQHDASAIAFAHHADDQVETALMRAARGSSVFGLAGMRRCRRWGMGFGRGPQDVGWAGFMGLDKWIVRPLLSVPKNRLIATCKAAGLDYVQDVTNFQPEATLRNSIRSALRDSGSAALLPGEERLLSMGQPFLSSPTPTSRVDRLRNTVSAISTHVDAIDRDATSILNRCAFLGPPATILLNPSAFATVKDQNTRLAMISQILAYISPLPWGSPEAEAGRRSESLQRVDDNLRSEGPPADLRPFAAGGLVLWSPVTSRQGRLSHFLSKNDTMERVFWLASRQPPSRHLDEDSLTVDITETFLSALSSGTPYAWEYDNRFLVQINPRKFSPLFIDQILKAGDQQRVLLKAHTNRFRPIVTLRVAPDEEELTLPAGVEGEVVDVHPMWTALMDLRKDKQPQAVGIRYIRPVTWRDDDDDDDDDW